MRIGAETSRRPNGVHRDVTASDHHDPLADIDRRIVTIVVSLHQIRPGQKFVRRNHPVQVLAGNTHKTRQSRARPDEHGRIAFFVEQRIDRHGTSYDHVGFDLDAQLQYVLNLFGHDLFFRQAEFGNSVLKHAAGLMQRFENLDAVSHFSQVGSAGQTGRAAADDGHFFTVGRSRRNRFAAVGNAPVADETFQFADRDRLALDTEDAGAFALTFLRAYAPAHRRQRTVLTDDARSFGEIALDNLLDKLRYLQRNGAVLYATRLFTIQTTARFELSLLKVVTVTNLLEIGDPHFRVLLPNGNTGYFICHFLF